MTTDQTAAAPGDRGLTPADLQNVRFTRASMLRPGYVDTEVDRVLSRVAEELGRLYAEKAALRDQVRSLQAQVERHRDPGGAQRPGGAHPVQRAADGGQLRRRGRGVQPPGHPRRPRGVRGDDAEARETAGAIIQAAQEAAAKIGPRLRRPRRRRRPDRRGTAGADHLPRTFGQSVRVQLRSYLEALLTDVEAEWGRADPSALPAEVVRPPRPPARPGTRDRPSPSPRETRRTD